MILVLTEAGENVGFGHLTRCQAICQNFESKFELVVHADSDIKEEGLRIYPWRNNLGELLAQYFDVQLVLVDSYLVGIEDYFFLKEQVKWLFVIDDYDRLNYPCDGLINPAISGPSYFNSIAKTVLSGPEWVVLRKEILSSEIKDKHGDLRQICIILGGSDKADLAEAISKKLCKLNFSVTFISGNDSNVASYNKLLDCEKVKVYGRLSGDRLAELFTASDLVVSAGGQTLNELAFLGVPFIVIQTGVDQFNNVNGFVQHGVSPKHLCSNDENLIEQLSQLLIDLTPPLKRAALSQKGKELIDGSGAKNIAFKIDELVKYP